MNYDYASMTYEELEEYFISIGMPKYRAGQLFRNISRAIAIEDMSDISKDLRRRLSEEGTETSLELVDLLKSEDGTEKYLFRLKDGNLIETVLMRYKHGNSVCISSQVGCAMGCKFCASTLCGKERNLTAGEMLLQVARVNADAGISNIVIMGIGEPLDNFDNLLRFLKNVNDPRGLNIGQRHISVSTCGIVDKIDRLSSEGYGITLSVSLHGPDNETRDKLMPVNKAFPIEKLIPACKRYLAATNRRISFEYTLVEGINDTDSHAYKLAVLLKGMLCHINLIPVNHVEERGMFPPSEKVVNRFKNILESKGMNATVRRTLGGDIDASCGQLRHRHLEK